ncbi:MAG TPA: glycosyltransferase family 4 protein [Bacteroidota bacterium]|nr:glycosyltransferase family 4 protein [Bacteroidota bacterium]
MEIPNKRIALICFSYSLGGLELSTLRLSETMCSKGMSTLLIVPPGSPFEERARATNVDTAILAPRWKYFDLATSLKLSRLLQEHRIEVAVLMRSQDINIASIASLFFPSIKLVFYQQMRSQYDKRDLIHTWIYSKLSLWISLTQSMKNEVLAFTRIPREKVTVVPLGTDLARFNPSCFNSAEAREYFALPAEKKIVCVVGRLDPQKGQDVLLRAIPEVVKEHSNVLFLIAGEETEREPGYRKYLDALCRDLGVGSFVRFMKFTDEVPKLMAAIDILALPSFSETYGLVLIEAMAMEKTIIATNAGGVPEIITNNKTGLLIAPHDEISLARALRRVLGDNELSRELARSGHTEALRRYDWNSCVDLLLNKVATL